LREFGLEGVSLLQKVEVKGLIKPGMIKTGFFSPPSSSQSNISEAQL
jgi:hypothetical protein